MAQIQQKRSPGLAPMRLRRFPRPTRGSRVLLVSMLRSPSFRLISFSAGLVCVIPCFATPKITVTPESAIIDTPLRVIVQGLQPRQDFLVRAIVRLDPQKALTSQARFRADADGRSEIENGTYQLGSMRLLWSMEEGALPSRLKDDQARAFQPPEPFDVLFEVEVDSQVVSKVRVSRLFVQPTITSLGLRNAGVVGHLFLPASKEKLPAVIVVGGSEGGYESAAFRAMLIASHGYAALAVAYFRAEGLPSELVAIPVETIRRACDYLSHRAEIDGGRIGIVGSSRGAELALLAASAFSTIKAVVAYSPSNSSWAALARGPQRAAWTRNGEPVPFVPNPPTGLVSGFKQMTSAPPPNLQGLILSYSHAVERASIPVEKINGAILLLAGKDDKVWPSSAMADVIIARLKEHGFRHPAEQISFDDAGHLINFPFLPTPSRVQLGGTPEGLARADAESWKRVLEFVATNLRDLAGGR